MATYVFVHGSFQAGWCWREIIPRLESDGHRCVALDLPAHGKDQTPPESVTLADYVRTIVQVVESLPEAPILVGHSMTSTISQAAEQIPARIRGLAYVAGFLLQSGQTMLDAVSDFDPEYLAQILWAPDRKTARLSTTGAAKFIYPLCPRPIFDDIVPLLTAEPVAPFEAQLQTTAENFGRVSRYYVECVRDRIIPVSLQRKMHAALPCKRVYSIDTDHSPFFSAPTELVSILLSIAEDE